MKKLNAVIVGKNINLVNAINFVLKDFVDVVVCSVLSNIDEVFSIKKRVNIDILFWDLDVENVALERHLKRLNSEVKEVKLIYISSNPENVLKAFNFGAVDFIQKPVSSDHLVKAIKKIKYLVNDNLEEKKRGMRFSEPLKFIAVSSLKDVIIIPVESIVYMQSEGRYTLIYKLDGEIIVSSKNLGLYEKLLNKNNFFRIHHSFLVNIDLSLKIQKGDGVYLQIVNNKSLPISKRRVEDFYRFLKIIA